MAEKRKYYVVWVGREPGVYDIWEDAREQVEGYPGARYKSFASQSEAIRAFRGDDAAEGRIFLEMATRPAVAFNYMNIEGIDLGGLAVDAACSGNPGPVEYQGVDLLTGQRIFHGGPFQDGSNNIGEYIGLVHAIALCQREGQPRRTIYTDSRIALSWLRNRGSRTKIAPTAANRPLFELLMRADNWVKTHTWLNPILKWNTELWGEIPADFGRK